MSKIYVDEIAGIASADTVAIPGHVIQVVQGTTTTDTTNSTSSYSDTTLSASITPSSTSSKILVIVSQQAWIDRDSNVSYGQIKLFRGSTELLQNQYALGVEASGGSVGTVKQPTIVALNYLDSPTTTSSTTYKTQGVANTTLNNGLIRFQVGGDPSFITLMEIAG